MNETRSLPEEKKLTVIFRVEAGCLGPDGADHVEGYCAYAEREMATVDAGFVRWSIVPRHDKAAPEWEYRVGHKRLSHDQAARYLEVFGKDLDEFEGHLQDRIALLIEGYLRPQAS